MSSEPPASAQDNGAAASAFPVRARQLLKVRAVWISPLVLGLIVVALITTFYIGSVVDPVDHLHGLPVAVVNQDSAVSAGGQQVNLGLEVERGLSGSTAVTSKLALTHTTLSSAEQAMNRGAVYAVVDIPPGFTASLLTLAGVSASGPGSPSAQIKILTNQRAGGVGVSLATGVLQPALGKASSQIGPQLAAHVPAKADSAQTQVFLANPVTVTTSEYRQVSNHAALGLSAFYAALLILMSGFLAGTIVNSSVDTALGYATTEMGPRWRQRLPLPINRWQTLLIKWVVAAVAAGLMTGFMLLIATGILRMDTPNTGLLWLLAWVASVSVAEGTIVLFAVLGALGQILGMLIFVYAGLATSGATIPLQALPRVLEWIAEVEPLRQIVGGTRAILYYNAQADAGLARAFTAAALGLVFWLVLGTVVVRWYDRRGFNRLSPELLAYVASSAQQYRARKAQPGPQAPANAGHEHEAAPGVDSGAPHQSKGKRTPRLSGRFR
jgi:YhgE/Pip-like protein